MNCNRLRTKLAEHPHSSASLSAAYQQHLETCELCRHWMEDRLLCQALASGIPEPSPGFEDRVLARAVGRGPSVPSQQRTRYRAVAAAAAGLAAAVAVLVALLGDSGQRSPLLASQAGGTKLVNIVIDAKQHRMGALVTVELADDLELDGYSGQRLIEWRTDLAKGKHLLALPVRLRNGTGGDIRVALSYDGDTLSQMRIPVSPG